MMKTRLALILFGIAFSNFAQTQVCDSEAATKEKGLSWGPLTAVVPGLGAKESLSTVTLIDGVLKRISVKHKESIVLLDNLEHCLNNSTKSACVDLLRWIHDEVPNFLLQARLHLALALSPHDFKNQFFRNYESINEGLSSWDLYKFNPWEPLSSLERTMAERALKNLKKLLSSKFDELATAGLEDSGQKKLFIEQGIRAQRFAFYEKYKEMMGLLPLMQFLTTAQPSFLQMTAAINQLRNGLNREQRRIENYHKLLENFYSTATFDRRLLEILSYRAIVNQYLHENSEYCGLFHQLSDFVQNDQLIASLSLGLPIMVGTFFVPPAVGMVVGFSLGGGFVLSTQVSLEAMSDRVIHHIYGDESGQEFNELSQLKRSRDFEIALLPLGLGVAPAAGKSLARKWFIKPYKPSARFLRYSFR